VADILIIDKGGSLVQTLRRATEGMPVRLRKAGAEADALTAARSRPALVFVRTGGWSPGEVPRLIRRMRGRGPGLPVAVVASGASTAEELTHRRLGILCYLQEPVSCRLVREVVRGAISLGPAPAPPAEVGKGASQTGSH
jgi:DNA-binding NtrC family response regulator